ncbi:MAG: carbohydrate ABC transporter permease [Christensenellales bacterium]|jgi:putative aldouronate transport system permease protein
MKIKQSFVERVFEGINILALIALVIVTLYPFYHVLMASISNPHLLARHTGVMLIPQGFSTKGYEQVLQNPNILTGYKNTLFNVVVGTSISMLITILSAYVLSQKGYMLKRFFTLMAVFTMFFSGGLIPFYLQVQSLGLSNSRWAMIFPSALSTFNLIVLRTAFDGVPGSLLESAGMDGANDVVILFRIVCPLSLPTIAIMILFYGVSNWNAWFNAMIFLRKRALYPIQLILREILVLSDTQSMTAGMALDGEMLSENIKYATIIVTTLPILFVYPFLQRYFVKGLMIGAVKG